MPATQLNVRIDSTLKREGDLALQRAGYTPTQAVRALWSFASRAIGNPAALRKTIAHLECENASEAQGRTAGEDAATAALKARAELYEQLGIPHPHTVREADPLQYEAILQEQADSDRALLAQAYAERAAERGL